MEAPRMSPKLARMREAAAPDRFSGNPAYVKYRCLLRELAMVMHEEGGDGGARADLVREQMDDISWGKLTEQERSALNRYSVELYEEFPSNDGVDHAAEYRLLLKRMWQEVGEDLKAPAEVYEQLHYHQQYLSRDQADELWDEGQQWNDTLICVTVPREKVSE